jgi:hypothetical protein
MNFRRLFSLSVIGAFGLILTSCGGSSNTPPPATVTVSLSGQPASLTPGATASITATVSNGAGVTWSVTCAVSACGSFSPATTASGAATTYTAPSAPTSVTVTATTSSGTSASSSATITIAAPAISVTLTSPPTSIAAGATASLIATVANDTQSKGVTWSVSCSTSGACGSFSPTSTASGAATTYTAPAAIPSAGTVTITATSVTDTTKSASVTITITAPGVSVALNPTPPASIIIGATANLVAVVSNDSKNAGVTWTATCSISPCGSFSSTSTASGVLTTYTAPTTVPSPNTVTVTATSVTDTTKSASATITITAVLPDGSYVYHFSGWDSTGPSFFAGALTISGGVITAGEQDFSDASTGYALDTLVPANCSMTAAGGNVQIVLGTSNTALGVNGNETLRGTIVSSSRVLVSEFDAFGTANGSIDLQTTPVAALSGGYAFNIAGWDINNSTSPAVVNPLAFGGVLNFSGTSLSITGSVFDFNLGLYVSPNVPLIGQAQLFTSGSISGPDAFGRISISLVPTTSSGVPSFVLTGYILSPSQIQLVESQADTLSDDLGGMAIGQGSNTGKFSSASVASTTYVFASPGEDVASLATYGGALIFGANGALTGSLAVNDLTNFTNGATNITGTYTVDPTGRATLSNIVTSLFSTNVVFAFQLYLDGNGNALHMGVDDLEVTSGPAYLQNAPSNDFEGTYALSGSGLIDATGLPAWGAVGPVTVTSDNLTGTADYNAQGLTPTPAVAVKATENSTPNTNSLSLVGLDSSSFTSARLYTYFPIDSNRVFAIETDGAQLGILRLESTKP